MGLEPAGTEPGVSVETLTTYTRVRLLTDRYRAEGTTAGDVGYIIEIYPDGAYEVEFSDRQGISYAQIVVNGDEIETCEQAEDVK